MSGFASRTPYDLRHILPSNPPKFPWLKPKELMCNYVSVVDHEFNPQLVETIRSRIDAHGPDAALSPQLMEIVWSVAARVRREIKERLDSGLHNDLIGIMKLVSDWRTQQKGEMHRTRYLSWLVTNLGVLDGKTGDAAQREGGWSLHRAELILSAETPSAAFSASLMTVKDGDMCVTCSWQECVVDAKLGEGLVTDLKRWLNDIGS